MNKITRSISTVNLESTILGHRDAVIAQIDTYDDILFQSIIVSNLILKIEVKFTNDIDGTGFKTWLESYFTTNAADFESANVNIHDCNHDTNTACDNLLNWDLE